MLDDGAMIDSHAHIGSCKMPPEELVAAAREAGVRRILTVGMDEASNREAIAHAERFEEVFAAIGRHPNAATGFDQVADADIRELAAHPRVRAIGETGLDFYRDTASPEDQRRAFAAQAELARELGLPLVIHVRDPEGSSAAVDEVFETLGRLDRDAGQNGRLRVILHCFSAPARVGDAAERGWYCSFAGNVTYPSAGPLREAAALVPDHLLLVETDSPYLSPVPRRGKPNQPAHVTLTAATIAEVRGVSPERIGELAEANSAALFGW